MNRSFRDDGSFGQQLEFAKKVAAAAAELPIDIVLSMVVEGLQLLGKYRELRSALDAGEALQATRAVPRPVLSHYISLIEEFVTYHDVDDEEATANFSARLSATSAAAAVKQAMNELELESMLSDRDAAGLALPAVPALPTAGALCMSGRQQDPSTSYFQMLAVIRQAFEVPLDSEATQDGPTKLQQGGKGKVAFRSAANFQQRHSISPPVKLGIDERLFCEFIAPALTLSTSESINHRFVARTNVTSSGYITWDAFSNFFVKLHGDMQEETAQVQFVTTSSDVQHNATVRKLLFTKHRLNSPTFNAAMDRYCLSAGYDGTVHMWETTYYDHVCRLHYIPSANKAKRWVNDMAYTANGRLAIAQSRGVVYMYSLMNPTKPYLHRVFRSGSVLSEDEEQSVRAEIERVRMQQGKTRFTAIDIPQAEMCVMTSPLPGDVVTVHGPARASKFSSFGHVEPLLVGLDSGLVHLYNVYKPIEFKAQVHPTLTYNGFSKANVFQVMDNAMDYSFLCAGSNARGVPSIHVVDYEKSEATLVLQAKGSTGASIHPSSAFTRFDYDDSLGMLVASGATRSATIFSTAFPDPLTTLSDHSAPLVGAVVNAAQYQIFTFTEDHTFHLFDIRMFRKVQAFSDVHGNSNSSVLFGTGGFDGTRGCVVAASSIPVALVLHEQEDRHHVAASPKVVADKAADMQRRGLPVSPSGLASDLRRVQFNPKYNCLLAAEGSYVVMRSGETMEGQDAALPLPDAVVAFAFDETQRKMAVLVQGRQCHVLSTMGGHRLLKWAMDTVDVSDEGSTVCFAAAKKDQQVVVVGTADGSILVYDLAEDGVLIGSVQLSSGAVAMSSVTQSRQRILIGTMEGDVFCLAVDTMTLTVVLDFAAAHDGVASALEFGVKEASVEAATATRGRSDSLVAFRTRAYTAMDRAVEAIVDGFDGVNSALVLYGSGVLMVLRITSAEAITVLKFPSVETITSASALAFFCNTPTHHSIAVGDFNGVITFYAVRKLKSASSQRSKSSTSELSSVLATSPAQSSPPTPALDPNAMSRTAEFGDSDVTLERQIRVTSRSFVSDVCYLADGQSVAASLSEELAIVILSCATGHVLSVLCRESRFSSDIEVGQTLLVTHPESTSKHPFLSFIRSCASNTRGESATRVSPPQHHEASTKSFHASVTVGWKEEHVAPPSQELLVTATQRTRYLSLSAHSSETGESTLSGSQRDSTGLARGKQHGFMLPKGSANAMLKGSGVSTVSPRGKTTTIACPASANDVSTAVNFGCSTFHVPHRHVSNDVSPRRTEANGARPQSGRTDAMRADAMRRLYPQPPTASRPASGALRTLQLSSVRHDVESAPLVEYPGGLEAHPAFTTRDVERLRPPVYSARRQGERPPSAPVFRYQRKTAEMSHKTDKLLQDAVDNATSISSRIVSNLRQRRLLSAANRSGTSDGRVFLTLEQQPIPPEVSRAVLSARTKK